MEENKNNKKKILILGILLVIVTIGVLGITYAAYNFQREGDSNELVAGDIYMHYKGKNAGISIEDAVPSKTYDPKEYFEFTIDGKNTYTEKDIWYEIDLVDGDEPEGRKTRIADKYLRFILTEKIGSGQEKTVVNSAGYDDITNKKIWVNKIDKNTTNEITITYKLYMWISDEVHIGYDDENEIQSDYTPDEWNNDVYASVKVNVKGDFIEKSRDESPEELPTLPDVLPTNMVERLKRLAYVNEKEMIELDVTDKSNITKCKNPKGCAEKEEVEYRYSGPEVNNYIYLKDNNNSDELWRIIGVFKDDAVGEYIKVVRDSILPESYLPETFKVSDNKTYKIQYTDDVGYKWGAYWNNLNNDNSDKNNWPIAGLQYWLNAEENDAEGNKNYLSYLSSDVRDQLVSVKHYLGTIHTHSIPRDTPKEEYVYERDVESCVGEKGNSDPKNESSGCHVWSGNDATWLGKVSLMYPSDYGLSASVSNWSSPFYAASGTGFEDEAVNGTSWMFNTMPDAKNKASWLLSPTSSTPSSVLFWYPSGFTDTRNVYDIDAFSGVRPVLSLSSSVTWLDGDGTNENPYKIVE